VETNTGEAAELLEDCLSIDSINTATCVAFFLGYKIYKIRCECNPAENPEAAVAFGAGTAKKNACAQLFSS
jgi:hypothetical protein